MILKNRSTSFATGLLKDESYREDIRLIKNIKTGVLLDDSYVRLSKKYENVFYKICHGYSSSLKRAGIFIEDIFGEKDNVLLNCIKSFKPSKKSKLSTWIGNHARFLCLNSINARRLITTFDSEEIQSFIENGQPSDQSGENIKVDMDFVNNILSQISDSRINQIITLRYFSDKKRPTWKKIGKKMNISSQTAINLHNKGLTLLRKKMSSSAVSDKV